MYFNTPTLTSSPPSTFLKVPCMCKCIVTGVRPGQPPLQVSPIVLLLDGPSVKFISKNHDLRALQLTEQKLLEQVKVRFYIYHSLSLMLNTKLICSLNLLVQRKHWRCGKPTLFAHWRRALHMLSSPHS